MNCSEKDLRLYAVTDRSWLKEGESLADAVEKAIEGGVSFVQLREKTLSEDLFAKEAVQIQQLCRSRGIPFVVNDNVEIARQMNADGVHVGQSDMKAGNVRALLGPDKILGVSAQTVEQALEAEKQGADYLGVGAVFATSSKEDAKPVSLETLRAICNAVSIPVIAIGGVNADNIAQLKGSGICGAAVISAIFAAEDEKQAAADLRRAIEQELAA